MAKPRSVATAYLGITIVSLASGCDGNDTGKPCDLTIDAGPSQAVAYTLDPLCESHLCLKPSLSPSAAPLAPPTGAGCSVECRGDFDCMGWIRDSTNPTDTRCQRGFVCAVPFEVGQLCCRKLCVCMDFLDPNRSLVPIACTNPDSLAACRKMAGGSVARVGQQTDFYLNVAPLPQNLCLEANLVDTDPSTPEIEPDCRAVYRVPTVDATTQLSGYQDVDPPLSRCPAGATSDNVSTDCWRLESDAASCPGTGLLVSIVRGAAAMSAGPLVEGTKVAMKCWTCPALTSSAGCAY